MNLSVTILLYVGIVPGHVGDIFGRNVQIHIIEESAIENKDYSMLCAALTCSKNKLMAFPQWKLQGNGG